MRYLYETSGNEVLQVEPGRVSKPATPGRANRMLGGGFTEFLAHEPRWWRERLNGLIGGASP